MFAQRAPRRTVVLDAVVPLVVLKELLTQIVFDLFIRGERYVNRAGAKQRVGAALLVIGAAIGRSTRLRVAIGALCLLGDLV